MINELAEVQEDTPNERCRASMYRAAVTVRLFDPIVKLIPTLSDSHSEQQCPIGCPKGRPLHCRFFDSIWDQFSLNEKCRATYDSPRTNWKQVLGELNFPAEIKSQDLLRTL